MDSINDAITYLEGSIVKFNELRKLVNSSTDIKQKTKFNETLYVIMEDAKEYIIYHNICEFGLDSVNDKPFLDGLIRPSYFTKDIGYLVLNLKAKIQ